MDIAVTATIIPSLPLPPSLPWLPS